MIKICFLVGLGTVFGFLSLFYSTTSYCDENVYAKLVTISGEIRTVEPETGRTFIPNSQALVFQRVGCSKCIISVMAYDGEYRLRIGKGKYRIIVDERGKTPGGSYLHPNQPRFIDAQDSVNHNIFNVKLARNKTKFDLTIEDHDKNGTPIVKLKKEN